MAPQLTGDRLQGPAPRSPLPCLTRILLRGPLFEPSRPLISDPKSGPQ